MSYRACNCEQALEYETLLKEALKALDINSELSDSINDALYRYAKETHDYTGCEADEGEWCSFCEDSE